MNGRSRRSHVSIYAQVRIGPWLFHSTLTRILYGLSRRTSFRSCPLLLAGRRKPPNPNPNPLSINPPATKIPRRSKKIRSLSSSLHFDPGIVFFLIFGITFLTLGTNLKLGVSSFLFLVLKSKINITSCDSSSKGSILVFEVPNT